MTQATLAGDSTADSSQPSEPESNEADSGNDDNDDPYDFLKYLDVERLKFIHALAATFDSVDEADKFIEAERKRWDRDDVLSVLTAQRDALKQHNR